MRITIYRLTGGALFDTSSIKDPHTLTPVKTNDPDGLETLLYIRAGAFGEAKWVKELRALTDSEELKTLRTQSSSAILLARRANVVYAVAFGNGYHAVDPSKIERGFGVRVTANAIIGSKVKAADTRSLTSSGRSQRVVLPQASAIADLGIDPTDEWVRKLSGDVTVENLATTAAGSDSLRLTIKDFGLGQLAAKLDRVEELWTSDAYTAEFGFLDNFVCIDRKDPIVAALDARVTQLVRDTSLDIYFAAPDPFEIEAVDTYCLSYYKQVPIDELSQDQVYGALSQLKLKEDPLNQISIEALDEDGKILQRRYSLYYFIQAELDDPDDPDARYVLSAGSWFRVNKSYVHEVQSILDGVEDLTDELALPNWPTGVDTQYVDEGTYNDQLARDRKYALLDKKNLSFGQQRKVEVCDLLTEHRQMLCVKRASRSSTLSHLFAQGSVSASLMHEQKYQDKVLKALNTIAPGSVWGAPSDWKVVYAIGTDKPGPLADSLFFFSKVNLVTHINEIRSRHVKVALARIEMS